MNLKQISRSTARSRRPYRLTKSLLIFLFLGGTVVGALGQGLAADLTSSDLWKPDHVPFAFKYGGKESAQLLSAWQTSDQNATVADAEIRRYLYTDPATKLTVVAEVRLYPDFPGAIDWVLTFRNDGTSDTPIIETILPLHWTIASSSSAISHLSAGRSLNVLVELHTPRSRGHRA
jgi:hypothetical protein